MGFRRFRAQAGRRRSDRVEFQICGKSPLGIGLGERSLGAILRPTQAVLKRDRAGSQSLWVREGGCRDNAVPAEARQKNDRAASQKFQRLDEGFWGDVAPAQAVPKRDRGRIAIALGARRWVSGQRCPGRGTVDRPPGLRGVPLFRLVLLFLPDLEPDLRQRLDRVRAMQREQMISALRRHLPGKRRAEKEQEPIVQSHFEGSFPR